MRRVLLVAVAVLTLLVIAAVARVAASVFMVQATPGWVADGNDVHGDPLPEGAIARLGTVRFRTTTLTNLCWLDDGRIASGGFDDEIVIWDARSGERTQVLAGHRGVIPEPLRHWSWRETRDAVLRGKPPVRHDYLRYGHIEQVGNHLISAGASVREWDLRTGAGRLLTTARGGNISSFDMLENGHVIRYTIGTREYRFDRRTGKREKRHLVEDDGSDMETFTTPDGRWRIGSAQGKLTLVDTRHGSQRKIAGPHPEAHTRGFALSPDGKTLWCIWRDGRNGAKGTEFANTLTAVELETARLLASATLDDPDRWWWIACSPDGRLLAVSGVGGRAQLRDAATLDVVHEIDSPPAQWLIPAFSPDGAHLALRVAGTAVTMYDVATGERVSPALGHEAPVFAAIFLDDQRIMTAAEDGTHRAWEVRTGRLLWTRSGTRVEIPASAPSGDVIAVATETGSVEVRIDDGTVASARSAPDGWQGVGTAPDGTLLLESDSELALLAPDDREPRVLADRGVPHDVHDGLRTSRFAWDPDGDRLLLRDESRTEIDENSWSSTSVLRLIDTRDGETVWTAKEMLSDAAVDFHGHRIALAAGYTLLIFGEDGGVAQRISLPRDQARAVAFSPDGQRIATGDGESVVHVWSLPTGTLVKTLRGHGGAITSLTWSPDGTLLVSTSHDTSALVWDVGE